jgi:hypothetical protein
LSDRTLGRKMTVAGLRMTYRRYKLEYFRKLSEEDPTVIPEDRQKIKELLKKPWNPYIRRHYALTEKSTILKEHVLRQHAGWSGGSQMHLKRIRSQGIKGQIRARYESHATRDKRRNERTTSTTGNSIKTRSIKTRISK